jgi:predicted dehydrogenase
VFSRDFVNPIASPLPHPSRRSFLKQAAGAGALALASSGWAGEPARKWRVAVIGHTGRGDFGHGLETPWRRSPEAEIVGVADAGRDGEAKAQQRFSGTRFFADYRRMLGEVKPDIVLITPRHADQHLAMTQAAVEAGAKGIYLEKPLCRTLGEADAMIAACTPRGVAVAVAHRNRYHPALPVVQRLVSEGAIGRLLEIRGRGKEDNRGPGTDLWVLGSHVLNTALCFTGRPVACAGTLLSGGRPATKADLHEGGDAIGTVAGDELHVRFDTATQVPIFFDSKKGAGVPSAGFGLQLIGTEGVIDLRVDETPLAHHLAGNPFRPVKEPRAWTPITSGGLGQPDPIPDVARLVSSHELAARDLHAAIRERRAPLCSLQDARTLVELTMATFESHRHGGTRVELPFTGTGNPLDLL